MTANQTSPAVAETLPNWATFQINSTKLYVLAVTLPINDNIKLLENMKQGFKRAVSWNENRSKITTQSKNNNLDNAIYPTFSNINRLFVISFKNGQIDAVRDSFVLYAISRNQRFSRINWQ